MLTKIELTFDFVLDPLKEIKAKCVKSKNSSG